MSRPEWAADIDIDVELASELVGAAFPELRGLNITPFGNGWDNAAFLLDETIVFRARRKRKKRGAALLRRLVRFDVKLQA